MKFLSAHRTYISDCFDSNSTYAISTTFKGHENTWNFHRVGALTEMRYVITLANSKLCKDNVNQNGWALTMAAPEQAGDKQTTRRSKDALYTMVSKVDMGSGKSAKMPVWRLVSTD